MKYIVKVEVAVYEDSDDMSDIVRVTRKATANDKLTAANFGEMLDSTVSDFFKDHIRQPDPEAEFERRTRG